MQIKMAMMTRQQGCRCAASVGYQQTFNFILRKL
jgi:hypothetical protein